MLLLTNVAVIEIKLLCKIFSSSSPFFFFFSFFFFSLKKLFLICFLGVGNKRNVTEMFFSFAFLFCPSLSYIFMFCVVVFTLGDKIVV